MVARLLGPPLIQPPDQLRVVIQGLIPFWLVQIPMIRCHLSNFITPESASTIFHVSAHLNVPFFYRGAHHVRRGGPGVGRLKLLRVE